MERKHASYNKFNRGFTLVELLLVLVLISISMAAIVPQLSTSLTVWQARETSKNAFAVIRFARYCAVTKQQTIAFIINTQCNSYTIKRLSEYNKLDNKRDNFLISPQSFGKDIKIVRLDGFVQAGNENILVFWPDGGTETASVVLTNNNGHKTLQWHILTNNNGSVLLKEILVE